MTESTTATPRESRPFREGAVAALTSERTWLANELSTLKRGAAQVARELAKVEGALAALDGQKNVSWGPGKSRRSQKTRTPRKRTASLKVYKAVVTEVLAGRGELSREDLFAEVGDRIGADGHSRVGIAVRVPRALRELGFGDKNGCCWEIREGVGKSEGAKLT